tara:strand:+ start:92 stop:1111 length:1020 start_codon:yes stop_codon:yes gene_type:complete
MNQTFHINGINCNDILLSELEQSFYGTFQENIYSALCFYNWSKQTENKIYVVNTLENLAATRAIYYFAKKGNQNCKFVSIQHSEINSNKIEFINHKNEFQLSQSKFPSPVTDFYFVHGTRSFDIVSQYMPHQEISKIGCVKYDDFPSKIKNNKNIKLKINNDLKLCEYFVVLIAPSIGVDFFNVLDVIKELDFQKYKKKGVKFVLSPHMLFDKKQVIQYLDENSLNKNLIINYTYPSNEMIFSSNLLITGYSSMAFESLIFGVPSIRVAPRNAIPLYDDLKEIPIAESTLELEKNIDFILSDNYQMTNVNKMVEEHFYKIDGNSSKRFWVNLKENVMNQ